METIALGATGRDTSRLGFGCSSIMGALGRKDSLALLETAFDSGIRHFDVAPSYGYGEAEACLGEFFSRHRGALTVTTKHGIPAPKGGSLQSFARSLARPFLKAMPGLKQRLAGAAAMTSQTGLPAKAAFTPDQARLSLERSLAALRVDRIDVWLLHEAEAADLDDDRLLRLLDDLVYAGTIGSYGIGSEAAKIPALLRERPQYCKTLQYEWSIFDPLIAPGEAFRIHHRTLTENFRSLQKALAADAPRRTRWSQHCGADVGDAEILSRLMLKAALLCNPQSVVLFSSKRPGHIAANASLADDHSLDDAALRLYSLARAEAVVTPAVVERER